MIAQRAPRRLPLLYAAWLALGTLGVHRLLVGCRWGAAQLALGIAGWALAAIYLTAELDIAPPILLGLLLCWCGLGALILIRLAPEVNRNHALAGALGLFLTVVAINWAVRQLVEVSGSNATLLAAICLAPSAAWWLVDGALLPWLWRALSANRAHREEDAAL